MIVEQNGYRLEFDDETDKFGSRPGGFTAYAYFEFVGDWQRCAWFLTNMDARWWAQSAQLDVIVSVLLDEQEKSGLKCDAHLDALESGSAR